MVILVAVAKVGTVTVPATVSVPIVTVSVPIVAASIAASIPITTTIALTGRTRRGLLWRGWAAARGRRNNIARVFAVPIEAVDIDRY
jgi:hypothetical protein